MWASRCENVESSRCFIVAVWCALVRSPRCQTGKYPHQQWWCLEIGWFWFHHEDFLCWSAVFYIHRHEMVPCTWTTDWWFFLWKVSEFSSSTHMQKLFLTTTWYSFWLSFWNLLSASRNKFIDPTEIMVHHSPQRIYGHTQRTSSWWVRNNQKPCMKSESCVKLNESCMKFESYSCGFSLHSVKLIFLFSSMLNITK